MYLMYLTYEDARATHEMAATREMVKNLFYTAMNTRNRRIIKRVFKSLNAAIRDIFITLVAYTGASILDEHNHRFPLLHLV